MIIILLLLFGSGQGPGECSAQTHNEAALARLETFDFKGAVAEFQAALTVNPESLVVRVNLSLAHFYVGDFEDAKKQLKYVLRKDPLDPYAQFLSGVISDREGRTEDTACWFEGVLDVAPGDPGTYYHLGMLALREDQPERAIELFRKSIAGNPDCSSSLYNLGRALVSIGKRAEGKAALEEFRALQIQKKPKRGRGMGDPVFIVGRYGQPRRLSKN